MKMSAVRRKKREEWVMAATLMIHQLADHIECPECGIPALQMHDVEYGCGPRMGLDRYLFWSHCGGQNIVNLRRAGPSAMPLRITAE
jgi:hypothetical protein